MTEFPHESAPPFSNNSRTKSVNFTFFFISFQDFCKAMNVPHKVLRDILLFLPALNVVRLKQVSHFFADYLAETTAPCGSNPSSSVSTKADKSDAQNRKYPRRHARKKRGPQLQKSKQRLANATPSPPSPWIIATVAPSMLQTLIKVGIVSSSIAVGFC